MAKPTKLFVCQSCGASFPKWGGKCTSCGTWDSLVEEFPKEVVPGGLGQSKKPASRSSRIEFTSLDDAAKEVVRWPTGIGEFDRVTGGGIVPGSAILIGGDPGIGKSTLLLQVAAILTSAKDKKPLKVAYISGEEAVDQVRLRASRLGVEKAPVMLAAATSVRDIVNSLDQSDAPDVVIIDSIQTLYLDSLDSAPGTVSQVRGSAQELIRLAKTHGFALFLVGHVTKEGTIAGPKVVEHMVDAVLHFEGDRSHHFRILRAVKNRFGPSDEIGVFEMVENGLDEVKNPSALFLADRNEEVSGAAVFAGIEGTRPVLVEIQVLLSPSPLGTPRRSVVGWDNNRLSMILAVLETRCGLSLAGKDVYLNVAGGLRIQEPAADLAVAAAILSATIDHPLDQETVFFGEVGLSGEIRAVSLAEMRAKEAEKLGFKTAVAPKQKRKKKSSSQTEATSSLQINSFVHLNDLLRDLARKKAPKKDTDVLD